MEQLINNYHKSCAGIVIIIVLIPLLVGNVSAVDVTGFSDIMELVGHSGAVTSVEWSPDGKEIATGSWDSTIRIWDPGTGTVIRTLHGHTDQVNSIAWSHDGKRLASASNDHTIKIWDSTNWQSIKTIDLHRGIARSVRWSPNDSILASDDSDLLKFWDLAKDTNISLPYGNIDSPLYGEWSKDGSIFFTLSANNSFRFWNTSTGKCFGYFTWGVNHWGNQTVYDNYGIVALSPDGHKVAFGSYDIEIYGTATGKHLMSVDINQSVTATYSLAWSPDGAKLAVGSSIEMAGSSRGNVINIYDAATGSHLKKLTGQSGDITSLAWSPDGSKLASGSWDKSVIIWGLAVPNVYVTAVSVDRPSITIGENVTITVQLKNDGTADGVNVNVDLYDGALYNSTRKVDVKVNIANMTTLRWRTGDGTALGRHTLRIVVGRSEMDVKVMVTGIPSVHLKDVWVDRASATAGEHITVTADLQNNGTANATGVVVWFYDDTGQNASRSLNVPWGTERNVSFDWDTARARPGKHILKASFGKDTKETTVTVKQGPAERLDNPPQVWKGTLMLLFVIIIVLLSMYYFRRSKK